MQWNTNLYDLNNEPYSLAIFLNNYYKWHNRMPSLLSSCWACVHSTFDIFLKRIRHIITQNRYMFVLVRSSVGLLECWLAGGRRTMEPNVQTKAQCKSLNTICRRCSTYVSNEHGTIFSEMTIGMSDDGDDDGSSSNNTGNGRMKKGHRVKTSESSWNLRTRNTQHKHQFLASSLLHENRQ